MTKLSAFVAVSLFTLSTFIASEVRSQQPSPSPTTSASPSASPSPNVPLTGMARLQAVEALNYLHHVNNLEIQEGFNAQGLAEGVQAKALAKALVTDHQKNDEQVLELAAKRELPIFGFQPATYEVAIQSLLLNLGGTAEFDPAFLATQRESHQQIIERLRHYEQTVTDPEVKGLLTRTIPVEQGHLKLAGGQPSPQPSASPSPQPSASASPGPSPSPSPLPV